MAEIEEYEEEDYESDLEKDLLTKGDLKPCPFCGMEVELKHYHVNGNDWWYVACSHCKIAIDPLMWNNNRTKEEATEIWNRREKMAEIHEGHWEYEGNTFEDEQEMAQYAVDNESYTDPVEFERWLDERYDASEIIQMLKETRFCDSVLIDLEDDYTEWRVDEAEPAEPGKDYEFGGFKFKWVEDDDE